MAAPWALTGDLTGWSTSTGKKGLTKAHVIHHDEDVKKATVRLCGQLNNKPFAITRSAASRSVFTGLTACLCGTGRCIGSKVSELVHARSVHLLLSFVSLLAYWDTRMQFSSRDACKCFLGHQDAIQFKGCM
jgi:hypothetical protein